MRYEFEGEVWLWAAETAAWHFVTLPAEAAEGLRALTGPRRGWGSVRVLAGVGGSRWKTSVFPDSRSGSFLLPVKAQVRRAEAIAAGQTRRFSVELEL